MKNLLTISFLLLLCSIIIFPQSWQEQSVSVPSEVLVGPFSIVNENVCWASWSTSYVSSTQFKNGVIRSTDGGNTWSGGEIPKIETGIILWIEALDANTAFMTVQNWAGTGVQGIYKTTNGGNKWVRDTITYAKSPIGPTYIRFFDKNNGVVVGERNYGAGFDIYTTTNGGSNWNVVPQTNIPPAYTNELVQTTPMGEYGDCIWLTTVPAPSHGPRIFKSTDKGYHWTVIEPPGLTDKYLISAAFQDENNGLMVEFSYNKGKILKTTDGGKAWNAIGSPTGMVPNFIVYVPGTASSYLVANDANFAGGPGGSAYSLDEGGTWTNLDNKNHIAPCFYSASVGWSSSWSSNTVYKFSGSLTDVQDGSKIGNVNSYSLSQNYPNPFNPVTTINYSIKESTNVKITILNILGEEVSTLLNEEKAPGEYQIKFNAVALPSGVYFYKITAGNFTDVKKMLLLK